jgi:hypothetical protein
MTRFRFGAVLVLVAALAAEAGAQPPKPPAAVPFKQFGANPEQFFLSSVTRWTGQLALDLNAVTTDLANSKVQPFTRAALITQVSAAQKENADLDGLVRRGAPKEQLLAAFTRLDAALSQLNGALNQSPAAKQAVAGSLARADTAYHQLAAVLGGGDADPARVKRRQIRLADALDDAAEDLRVACADNIPGDPRPLDRVLGQFSREARLLSRRTRDDAPAELIKATYAAASARWGEATAILGRAPNLPPAVNAQLLKADGLHRRLGVALQQSDVVVLPPNVRRLSFAVGTDGSANPHVTVFADDRGTVAYSFFAYDQGFDGGVRVDMADLNGDGVPELVVAPGPGRGNAVLPVKVFDGRDLNLLIEFTPFPGWKGGLTVAAADLSKDGRALIAVAGDGVPVIKVFDLAQGKEIAAFTAHDPKTVTGGVRLGWADVNGDGIPDILAVNGPSNTHTRVKVFSGKDAQLLANFPVLDENYRGGGFVAAVDLQNNGQALPVVGLDAGTKPLVRVFDLRGKPVAEWLAYDERFRGGVRVTASARNRVVTAPGPVLKNSPVRVFDVARPQQPLAEIVPFNGYDGGLNVGGR